MKTKKNYILFLVLSVLLMSYSCVKDLDFDQLDQAVITPVLEADFIYSTFDISDYIPSGTLPNTEFIISEELRDTVNYDLVGTDFAIDNLDRIELTIEIRNTIQASFTFQFQFLSEANSPIGQVYNVSVLAQEELDPPSLIVLDTNTFVELSNAKRIATAIIINSTLNSDLRGVVDIRSKASYYINYPL